MSSFKSLLWDFPGGPVVKTSLSNAGGAGSIPGRGAKIPHASPPRNQNRKQKQYCNKFNKGFKKNKNGYMFMKGPDRHFITDMVIRTTMYFLRSTP